MSKPKIQIKHIKDGIYFDSKNHWKAIGQKFYGYNAFTEKVLEFIWRPKEDFEILNKIKHKTLTEKPVKALANESKRKHTRRNPRIYSSTYSTRTCFSPKSSIYTYLYAYTSKAKTFQSGQCILWPPQ